MNDSQLTGEESNPSMEKTIAADPCASKTPSSATPPFVHSFDEPTIVSGRAPLPAPSVSDSAFRIMEGRIMPGDHLEHFELIEYVGGGGMGRVFRALDTRLSRTVAAKILSPNQAADPETVQRFHNEAQSAARLDHENIARVYYVGEDRGIHFIVFEFIEGENIRKLVERKGPLSLDESICYTLQVVDALAHAAARHIVHRDIKPSNILITPAGRVKLIDMGLARLRQLDPECVDLTASGVTLGTFDYISPEQARDPRNADIRSDIYSLGCTLYYMLTGRPPFPQGTVLQKLLQHHGDPAPDVRQLRSDLPEEIERIMQKMMAKDPDHRYLDPNDLISDLMQLAEQIGLQPINPSTALWLPKAAPKDSFVRRNMPWLASVAVLICMVIALSMYWNPPRSGDSTASTLALLAQESLGEMSESKSISSANAADREKVAVSATSSKPNIDGLPEYYADIAPSSQRGTERKSLQELWQINPLDNPAIKIKVPPTESMEKIDAAQDNTLGDPLQIATALPMPTIEKPSAFEASAKSDGLLIVSNLAEGEHEFTSLAAACAAARNGDVIELRYNGRREEKPIRMANLRATIRAGKGYKPMIIFQPNDTDPIKYPRSMLSLNSGRLTISNVAIEFAIPRDIAADNWSLVEIRGGQTLRLDNCALTVANASDQMTIYHQDVAFIRVRSSLSAEAPVPAGVSGASPLATVELNDCIARGEAVFMLVEDFQPVHLAWVNGLLLTSEQLLLADGGALSPKPDEMLRIDLQHLTVVARGGLVRLASSRSAPYQFTVQFNCSDDIIMTSSGNSLIEQDVTGPLENAKRQIVWNGNHNIYPESGIFWTIRSLDSEPSSDTMSFDAWRSHWGPSRENQPFAGQVGWNSSPAANRPLHAQLPSDYLITTPLAEKTKKETDAVEHNTGMQLDRLIALPTDPISEKSPKTDPTRKLQ